MSFRIPALAKGLLLLIAIPFLQEPGARAPKAEAEVRAFLGHYIETLESRDDAAVTELFVPGGRMAWFTDGALAYSSPKEVLEGMRQYEGMRFQTSLSDVRVLPLREGLASASSSFETKITIPNAEDFTFSGVITWLLEQSSSSGKWQVLQGHTSTPAGPPRD